MGRTEHTFHFPASVIARAARDEQRYHEERERHWAERAMAALAIVKETIGARIEERPVTGGVQVYIVVDYGDTDAWQEYSLAHRKELAHRKAAERYRTRLLHAG